MLNIGPCFSYLYGPQLLTQHWIPSSIPTNTFQLALWEPHISSQSLNNSELGHWFLLGENECHSVLSNSLQPHWLYTPRNSSGQNIGGGSLSLLHRIFPTQRSNPGLPHCRRILYCLSHQGRPRILGWVAYPFSRGTSQPRNRTVGSSIAGRFLTIWATRKGIIYITHSINSVYMSTPISQLMHFMERPDLQSRIAEALDIWRSPTYFPSVGCDND